MVSQTSTGRRTFARLAYLVILSALALVILYASTTVASYSTIYVACYVAISMTLLTLYKRRGSLDVFSPVIGVPALVLLYSWGSGLLVDATGRTLFDDVISDSTRVTFYAAGLIGVAAFFGGALLAQRLSALPVRAAGSPFVMPPYWYLVAGVIGLFFALAFVSDVKPRFNPFEVQSYFDTALESRIVWMENTAAGVRDALTVYPAVVLLISFSAIAVLQRGVAPPIRIVGFLILSAYLATSTLAGARQTVVQALIIVAAYYHYQRKPLRIAVAALAGGALYAFVNVLSIARRSADPMEMFRLVSDHFGDVGADGLGLAASGELVTGANLHRLIEGLNTGQTDYMYGQNVINELLVFIPRAIYPDRPHTLAEQFVLQFYPGVLESGGGYGFFILQEGYWMLGLTGVLASMALFGFGLERLYLWFRRNATSSMATILYAWIYSVLVASAVRSGIVTSIKMTLLTIFPLLFLWSCFALLKRLRTAVTRGKVSPPAAP